MTLSKLTRHALVVTVATLAIQLFGNGLSPVKAQTITIKNNCSYTVYPGVFPPVVNNGGWTMNSGASTTFTAPSFNGRIWARLGCVAGSTSTAPWVCQSGQCGGTGVACAGTTGHNGTSLAEFNLHAGQGGSCPVGSACDWYDLSYVDGIDVPIGIKMTDPNCFSPNTCTPIGACPTVASGPDCLSPCTAYGGQYCCVGGPTACNVSAWPANDKAYIDAIHTKCPADYAYPFDDPLGLHQCESSSKTNNYTVTFCPDGSGSVYPKAPSAPTGVSATAGNTKITLKWTSPSGSLGDWIYRSLTPGGETATPINPGSLGIKGGAFTDSGLANGTTYYYTIKGGNAGGLSPASAEVHATPTTGPAIPAAPTGVNATGANAAIVLGWTASGGATSYNVYRSTAAGGEGTTAIASGITSTSFTNTGLTNGTKYFYKVAAVNSLGTSPQSSEVSATPGSTAPNVNGTWQMWPQSATGLRLNVSGNGTANGTLLTVSTSNGTTAQTFVFSNSGVVPAGDYNFVKTGGSYCVQPSGTASGSTVQIWACAGTAAQAWAVTNATTPGFFVLKPSSATGMCLNATGTASGSGVTIATCNSSSTNQSWGGL